ncbi:MAG: hypothetical protein J6R38_00145 [Alistipes sp.]|nr:hypothetical protein [Alistipes sp.]
MKKILLCVLMAIMGCCIFTSCEKDEGAYKQSSFVGTWYESYYNRWVFTKGGSITIYYNEGATGAGAVPFHDSGTYSYNKSQNTLALTITKSSSSYEGIYHTALYIVQSISAEQIVLIGSRYGDVVTLRKNK